MLGWAGRYQQALAYPSRRKLALLIGINRYPEQAIDSVAGQDIALRGALTDVELQRELLQYRFGFQPADILTLTNQEASRQRILDAIYHHLVAQARPDDIVVLHFSGYGSQIRLASQPGASIKAWVPVDGILPTEAHPTCRDLLEPDLQQALKGLKTNRITTVVDAGITDSGYLRWGTLRTRSRPTVPTGTLSAESVLATNPALQTAPWPGTLLRASEIGHIVLEGDWSGFSAGAFTYALTQVLWQTSTAPNLRVLIKRTGEVLQQWTGPDQKPTATTADKTAASTYRAYYLENLAAGSDGVITTINEKDQTIGLWLGGLPGIVLDYLQPGSQLRVMEPSVPVKSEGSATDDAPAASSQILRLISHTGLQATARMISPQSHLPMVGQPIYEMVRMIPHEIHLMVALDPQLERVERVDATSALAGISFVSSINAGEQPADCLFGRLPKANRSTLTAALDPLPMSSGHLSQAEAGMVKSYGLFAPNRTLIPGTLLAKEEAVKTAISRLMPHLETLLAMKLVRLTENRLSSRLAASAMLMLTQPQSRPLIWQQTQRGVFSQSALTQPVIPGLPKRSPDDSQGIAVESIQFQSDHRIRYQVNNASNQAFYLTLVSFDSQGQCLALIPPSSTPPGPEGSAEDPLPADQIAANSSQVLPGDTTDWGMPAAAAWVETHIILSTTPLTKTILALRQEIRESPQQSGLRRVNQPLKLATAILEDLSQAAQALDPSLAITDQYGLHQESWVTFSFRYPVS